MADRATRAVDFLKSVGAPAALESLEAVGTVESLTPSGPVPGGHQEIVERTLAKIEDNATLDEGEQFALEAIIIPDKRPVIDVLDGNRFVVEHPLWTHLGVGETQTRIQAAIASVGRVELPDHPSIPYGGTGFVVGPGLLMTNRHVAEIFAQGLGSREIAFRTGQSAAVDFEKRVDGGTHLLAVESVAMIHPYWDMALLRVEGLPGNIPPLSLAGDGGDAAPRDVVVIGYPAFDPRNDPDVQRQVFHGVFNVKRLMPGRLTGTGEVSSFGKSLNAILHDSSTLGGASGSAVFDPASGRVVALHFGGVYLKTNYGAPTAAMACDSRIIDAGVNFASTAAASGPWDEFWRHADAAGVEAPRSAVAAPAVATGGRRISVTVPVTVTVSLGEPLAPVAPVAPVAGGGGGGDVVAVESVAEDYADREGYAPDFLGTAVPLPRVVRDAADVLPVANGGQADHELRYEHFSVVMSKSRRMCFFSAVNIEGATSRKSPRVGWRRDPRIPEHQQILNECYGNPPKFSRGHMTRREDPVWGDADAAGRGNADSMCVTNTTPQMQAFNSPIWLALEDYALQHARSDGMRITVFTGPHFSDADPVMYGVRIPLAFWKVIAFIHDETGKLCATGYEMSQETTLQPPSTEFVFGDFRSPQLGVTTQVSLDAIAARSGLSFGDLADHDLKSGGQEALVEAAPLLALEQIQFTR